jgi:hypothetical protein
MRNDPHAEPWSVISTQCLNLQLPPFEISRFRFRLLSEFTISIPEICAIHRRVRVRAVGIPHTRRFDDFPLFQV